MRTPNVKKLLLCLALCFASFPGCAMSPKEVAREASVALQTKGDPAIFCSAVAIAPHTLVGAEHCFKRELADVLVDGKPGGLQVVALDGSDHVLVSSTLTFKYYVSVQKWKQPEAGEKLYTWGSPHNFTKLYREGIVAGHVKDPMGKSIMFTDIEMGNGDSGAGYFNEKGELVSTHSLTYGGGATWRMIGAWPYAFTSGQWSLVK